MSESKFCKQSPPPRTFPSSPALKLRVVGTERDGQTIELTASRSTIGAAHNCTLRLRAPGVRPLHCLILRRSDGSVVRSLSAETLLNGSPFREQSLRGGDRLQLGPIEFEVVDDEANFASVFRQQQSANAASPPEVPYWTDDPRSRSADLFERLDRLENRLQHADELQRSAPPEPASDHRVAVENANAAAEAAVAAAAAAQDLLEQERSRHETELADLHRQLEAAQTLMAEKTHQWQELCDRSQKESERLRSELDRQLTEITQRSHQFRQDLNGLRAELQQERQHFEATREAWVNDCQTLEDQRRALSQTHAELERRSLEAQQAFDVQREQWSQERRLLEESIAELQNRCASLEADAQMHLERCGQLELQIEQLQSVRNQEEKSWQPQTTASPPEPISDFGMTSGWSPPETSLNPKSASQRTEMTWLAQQFAATQDVSVETPDADRQPREPSKDLHPEIVAQQSRYSNDVARNEVEPASEPTNWPARTEYHSEALPERREPEGPQFSVRFLTNWQPPLEIVEPAETTDCAEPANPDREPEAIHSDQPMVDNDATVFDRLEKAGIWRSPEEDAAPATRFEDDLNSSESFHSHAGVEYRDDDGLENDRECEMPEIAPEPYPVPPAREESDDSIESYMERLLQRVRRGDGDPMPMVVWQTPVESRSPITEVEIPTPIAAPLFEAPKLSAEDYVPRSQAPELPRNLDAMRELANDSRHRNIRTHAERTWTSETGGKLLCATAAFSVSLACYFLFELQPVLAGAGIIGGLTLGGICVWQALSLRRRLFDSLRLENEPRQNDAEGLDHPANANDHEPQQADQDQV